MLALGLLVLPYCALMASLGPRSLFWYTIAISPAVHLWHCWRVLDAVGKIICTNTGRKLVFEAVQLRGSELDSACGCKTCFFFMPYISGCDNILFRRVWICTLLSVIVHFVVPILKNVRDDTRKRNPKGVSNLLAPEAQYKLILSANQPIRGQRWCC